MKPYHRGRGNRAWIALIFGLACGGGSGAPIEDRQAFVAQDRSGTLPSGPVPENGSAWVIFGSDTVRAEVARTSEQRARGLMYREDLPAGTGMLFVFDDLQIRSFWMQNTYVALDIAFLDMQFTVVDIQQMEALSERFHDSRLPAGLALEVPLGWFAEHSVRVGDQARIIFGGG
jgi:uncharacterized membrane protein (UPF0127 family)